MEEKTEMEGSKKVSKEREITHDLYFKRNFKRMEIALSFFLHYLPGSLKSRIQWDTLRLAPGEYVLKGLRKRSSDLLYEVKMGDQLLYLFLHMEHQRKSPRNMSYRLFIYQGGIAEQFLEQNPGEKPPLIYSIVLFQGSKHTPNWTAPLTLQDYLEVPKDLKDKVAQLPYLLVDLTSYTDEEIRGNLATKLALWALKHIDSPDIHELMEESILPMIGELFKEKSGLELIEDFLYYFSKRSSHFDVEVFTQQLEKYPETESIKEVVMTSFERTIQKGMEKGIVQVTSKQLKLKFQEKAENWIPKLVEYTAASLEKIAERIFTENSLEAVFQGLEKKSTS